MKTVEKVAGIDAKKGHESRMAVAEMLVRLETSVQFAKAGNFKWLEVEPEVLNHFLGGKETKSGYVIYKDIKLCLEGQAEDLARREKMTVHEVVFKKEADQMHVGVGKK